MTAIELYYSSIPTPDKPYCAEDEEETEISELEFDAYVQYWQESSVQRDFIDF